MQLLRLSEHHLSQQWLAQFHTSKDRALAAQLLNLIKLVSGREFESSIESSIILLQKKVDSTIAVYPVSPPLPQEIAGYDPFTGGLLRVAGIPSREAGRRRKYGSEDRVGHTLSKLQVRFKKGVGASLIECNPTLHQLNTQGIRHIVLVDDVSGSGKRISDYWRVVPRRIKSILSLKRYELWIILYAITPYGYKVIAKIMPNFPIYDHLITVLPETELNNLLSPELIKLCENYAEGIGMESSAMGYRGTACPVVFEHGCPNNLPAILWASNKGWKPLFPNRAIPTELRGYFDALGTDHAIETLWRANQPRLALRLLDSLDREKRLDQNHWMLMTLLGLRLRGVSEDNLPSHLLIDTITFRVLLDLGIDMGLYDKSTKNVTGLGKELVSRFRKRTNRGLYSGRVGRSPSTYYPSQCEGKFRNPGKTVRGHGRAVPMEQ